MHGLAVFVVSLANSAVLGAILERMLETCSVVSDHCAAGQTCGPEHAAGAAPRAPENSHRRMHSNPTANRNWTLFVTHVHYHGKSVGTHLPAGVQGGHGGVDGWDAVQTTHTIVMPSPRSSTTKRTSHCFTFSPCSGLPAGHKAVCAFGAGPAVCADAG